MAEERFDLIISGGTVYDGTGAAGITADVGIRGETIAAVGDLSQAEAGRTLSAAGRSVAPGFIDIHTHSDLSVIYDTGQASSVAMGVTTQVTGNCGLSFGLMNTSAAFEMERRWLAPHGGRIRWNSFADFFQFIESHGTANNHYSLAGHGSLRKRVMGLEARPPENEELTVMRRELAAALEAGAWGLSSGLEYPPSAFADEDELAALCETVSEYGGFYATHLRNEGDTLVEAVQEAMNVAERAGVPLQLSHHKAEGRANWGKVQTTLGMVDAARQRGLDVQLDQYPYTAFMTALGIQILPKWATAGTAEELTERLTDAPTRARIAAEIRAAHSDWDDLSANSPWEHLQVGVCRVRPDWQGRTLASLAREANANPIENALDLLAATNGMISAVNFAIGEADIADVMRYPWTAVGSDGVATHPEGTGGEDRIHPRAYGTFPRVLARYVRELGILTEAQAIHKMTGLPAARLGLKDRGRIAPGVFADITIYDPNTVSDIATFDSPHQYAQGIETVLVNGRFALENGVPTDARAGRVLRRQ